MLTADANNMRRHWWWLKYTSVTGVWQCDKGFCLGMCSIRDMGEQGERQSVIRESRASDRA